MFKDWVTMGIPTPCKWQLRTDAGGTVTVQGTSGEDAARRWLERHPARRVLAWRAARWTPTVRAVDDYDPAVLDRMIGATL